MNKYDRKILTIHEVRRRLDRAQKIVEKMTNQYLDNKNIDAYDLRSLYEYLDIVNSSKWTNQLL